MPKKMNRWSVDDVIIPVDLVVPDGANANTSTDTVVFQFTPGGLPPRTQPTSGGWKTGFWVYAGNQLCAAITVGPGTAVGQMQPGVYAIWVNPEDNPTSPKEPVDTLTIY